MNIGKQIIIPVLSFIFVFGFSHAIYSVQDMYAVSTGDNLNVRKKPGLKSGSLIKINKNTLVKILKVNDVYESINKKFGHWVYIEIPGQNETRGWVFDAFLSYNYSSSSKNKYIKYNRFDKNPKYYDAIFYEKYTVLGLLDGQNMAGFSVYKRKNDDIESYAQLKPVYASPKNEPANFICIYNDYLFIDYGTGPGHRGLTVYDLIDNKSVFEGSHDYPQMGSVWYPEFDNENEVFVYKWLNPKTALGEIPENNLVQMDYNNLSKMLEEAKSITKNLKQDPGYSMFEYSILRRFILNLKTKKVTKTNVLKIVQEQG